MSNFKCEREKITHGTTATRHRRDVQIFTIGISISSVLVFNIHTYINQARKNIGQVILTLIK